MKLVIEDEAGTRSVVPFVSDEITVGRAADGNTFRLGERNVSRRHARFFRANGAVWVEDLGSLVGTLVNGERVEGKRRLRAGDLVEIGDYDLAVIEEEETPAPGAPPPLPAPARPPTPRPAVPMAPAPEPTTVLAPEEVRALAGPALEVGRPAPARRSGVLRRAILMGVIGLAFGLAAGYAAGRLMGPVPAPTASSRGAGR